MGEYIHVFGILITIINVIILIELSYMFVFHLYIIFKNGSRHRNFKIDFHLTFLFLETSFLIANYHAFYRMLYSLLISPNLAIRKAPLNELMWDRVFMLIGFSLLLIATKRFRLIRLL